jgi:hypothetical protein
MSIRCRILVVGLVAVLALVVWAACANVLAKDHVDAVVRRTERAIAEANLIGHPVRDSITFLDAERIPHTDYVREDDVMPDANRTIAGAIGEVGTTVDLTNGPTVWDVRIELKFDQRDRLSSYRIWPDAICF